MQYSKPFHSCDKQHSEAICCKMRGIIMAKKIDLRVKRTNKMIMEAFIHLVEQKGYDNITVQEIADEAMINRATFYAHFKDKQDLMTIFLNKLLMLLPQCLILIKLFKAID